ncbi:hypothetical protein N9051_00410 [Akkermansiaceae bacterium]|nr:hypothetical protein [Akkermansiaceae bacterium]
MNETAMTYALYLAIAVPITIWVAKTRHKNGRVFLVDCFHGNTEMAESVNHLLVVGFHLINIGFVTLYLRLDFLVQGVTGIFEALSGKLGVVLLVLGAMHFLNLIIFSKPQKKPFMPPLPVKPY